VFSESKIEPDYMEAILKSRELRVQIEARATGTGGSMKNISQDHIRSLLIPLPELSTQRELIRELQKGAASLVNLECAAKSAASLQTAIANIVVK
jgi:type I restriction enzyme S subunit